MGALVLAGQPGMVEREQMYMLARIGMMLESQLSNQAIDIHSWMWWLPDGAPEKAEIVADDESVRQLFIGHVSEYH